MKIQTELRNHISLEPLNCFRKTLHLKCTIGFLIIFCSLFPPSFFWKKSGDKTWLKMMLPTFQHWVSFLQYKKTWPAKKNSEFHCFKSKKLLLWGLHYIILCERNNASEKLSTAITKTTKYYYVCYHDKKYKR